MRSQGEHCLLKSFNSFVEPKVQTEPVVAGWENEEKATIGREGVKEALDIGLTPRVID